MILDADGTIMQNAYLGLRPGEDGTVTLTLTDCEADTFLTGTSNPGLIVEISEADADDWSRIDTNSLDLTPYDGTDQDFDIRFTDDRPDTLRDRVEFRLRIVPDPDYGIDVVPGEIELEGATVDMVPPSSSLFEDDFEDGTQDAFWQDGCGPFFTEDTLVTVVEAGGVVTVTPRVSVSGSRYNGYEFVNFIDASDRTATLEVVAPLSSTNTQTWFGLYLTDVSTTDMAVFTIDSGNLIMRRRISLSNSSTSIAYDGVAHRWLRIRETGGNLLWETAPDGSTWTTRRTISSPFSLASVKFTFYSGTFDFEATPGTAVFDNFSLV
jgi:hypothetical protein